MTRSHIARWFFAGAFIAAGIVVAICVWKPAAQRRATWSAARPALPDLAKWPEPFCARMAAIDARVASRTIDPASLGELARLYQANGFRAEAERCYRALLVLEPKEPHWPHLLAALLCEYGRVDEAVPLLQRTVTLASDYAPSRLRMADALVKLNRSDEAAAAYRALLVASPKNPFALLGLARIDLGAGRLPVAKEELETAVATDPKFAAGQHLLATVDAILGDEAGATAARARAADGVFRDAPDPWTEELIDWCYDVYRLQVVAGGSTSTRNPRDVLPLLERALTLAPDNAATRRQLGKMLLGLGEFPRAREQLEKAVALEPLNATGYIDLVGVYRATNDLPDALRNLEAGLRLLPDDAALHYEYALALLAGRRFEDAVPHLEAARRLNPEKPFAARDLISIYFRLNREREAAAVLDDALARHPEFPAFLVMGARYRIMKRDEAAAAALIARARKAEALPNDLTGLTEDFRRTFGRLPP